MSDRPRTQPEATRRRSKPPKARGGRSLRNRSARWWAALVAKVALVGFLLGVAAVVIGYLLVDIPQPNEAAAAQTSIVYYADGKTEMARISEVNRESVALDQVPDHVQKAMLAAEDRDFYENSGISPTGIARAAWVTLRGGETQGGSTITQQYVKNYFLTQDQTLSRKAREILISVKISRELSKDEILANYLNTIYYGRNAYGIKTAARAYFNKDVSKLTVSDGAMLASVIRAPSLYDPALGAKQKANVQSRFQYVIDGMSGQGWITPDQVSGAKFPKTVTPKVSSRLAGPNGYIIKAVRDELTGKLGLTTADIDQGGLRITSTIDKATQDAAVAAVKEQMPTKGNAKDLHVGLTAIKPGDGAIVASYGGADYLKQQFDTARQASIQAGSTFKIFTLIAALQDEISTRTTFSGASPQTFSEFEGGSNPNGSVTNFGCCGGEQFGRIDLRTATEHSVNTIFAQLNIKVGPERTKSAAIAAGLPDDENAKAAGLPPLSTNYANVLGTDSVRILDMANAYATIAAEGVRSTPYLVKKVTGGAGYDYEAKPETKAVFDKDVMDDTIDAMQAVVQSGTGQAASAIGRPAAGKTGTTSGNYGAWFDGYVPQLAAAVGIYKGDGSISKANQMNGIDGVGELSGGTVPVRLWTAFMQKALDGTKTESFPRRAGVGDDQVYVQPPPPSTTAPPSTTTTTTAPPSTTTTAPPTTTTTAPPTTPTRTRTTKPTRGPTTPAGGGGTAGGGSSELLPTRPPPEGG